MKTISLYPPAQLALDYQGQLWIDEPEPDGAETFATLATIAIKKHMEELEESLEEIIYEQQVEELKEENQTSSLVSFQDIFNTQFQT